MTVRQRFEKETAEKKDARILVVAVELPTGAIEVITNTMRIQEKIAYYKEAYDEDFRLKTNGKVRILDFMLV